MGSLGRVTFAAFDGSLVNSRGEMWANTDGGAWYIWSSPSYGAAKDYAAGKFFNERGSVHRMYVGYAWWRGDGEDEGSVSV